MGIEEVKIFLEYARFVEAVAKENSRGLGVEDLRLLLCVGAHKDLNLTQSTYQQFFGQSPSAVAGRTRCLKSSNLVTLVNSDSDGREKTFSLTEEGSKFYGELVKNLDKRYECMAIGNLASL